MSCNSPCSGVDRATVSRRQALQLAAAMMAIGTVHRASGSTRAPDEVSAVLPGAQLQGQGRLRYFGLHIYDAFLWTAERVASADAQATRLALELRYARTLRGASIAERSLDEMKGVGEVGDADGSRWLEAMKRVFPDVGAGDRITGIHRPGEGAWFYLNGRAVGELRDAQFARLFFGIWLSPRTSQPALRAALLGLGS